VHHPMPGPLALPTEAEISEFAAQAAEGFAQTGLYVPHFLVACGLAIVWVENTGSTRSHTPSNALLVFLAMAIPQCSRGGCRGRHCSAGSRAMR
jgi:hypothetical protein